MSTIIIEESAEIAAPAPVVYDIIADYREGHPSILPPKYFTGLWVEEGGHGAGTVIRFGMKIGGRTQEACADITEPEPGRVLVESVRDERGTATTFTVEPRSPSTSHVTFRTTWRASGLGGAFERLVAPLLLRRVYRAELANLDRVAQSRS